jgi:phosphatidylglycerol:prolipoprotein diacylglycerol transferase
MINIDINPIAFSIGMIEVRWYGIMVVLAIIAIIAISVIEARRQHFGEDHIYGVAFWGIIGGILGSRVIHVIDKWDYYIKNPMQILNFEGLGVYGAVFGIVLAIVVYSLVKKLSIWQLGDIISPGALVGMAIGRIGCILNGCCFGLPAAPPWAVIYSNIACYAPQGVPLHFTQLYHVIWNMAGFAVIWVLRRRLKPQGSIMLLYLAIYAAGDLIIRFLREGDPFLFGIQQAQLVGIVILVVTVPWLIIRMWRYRNTVSVSEPTDDVTEQDENQEG